MIFLEWFLFNTFGTGSFHLKKNLNLKIGFSKMHKWDFYRDTIILANEKVEFAMGWSF